VSGVSVWQQWSVGGGAARRSATFLWWCIFVRTQNVSVHPSVQGLQQAGRVRGQAPLLAAQRPRGRASLFTKPRRATARRQSHQGSTQGTDVDRYSTKKHGSSLHRFTDKITFYYNPRAEHVFPIVTTKIWDTFFLKRLTFVIESWWWTYRWHFISFVERKSINDITIIMTWLTTFDL
jgi:hypothetical protein